MPVSRITPGRGLKIGIGFAHPNDNITPATITRIAGAITALFLIDISSVTRLSVFFAALLT
jgi:hypothetical protein